MISYPLKFEPIYMSRLWGRELWLISGMPGAVSVVANGIFKGMALDHLIQEYKEAFICKGNSVDANSEFPLLVKILEAEQTLSVQVHPDDVMGKARGEARGKDEMWYVMEATKGASLVAGLKHALSHQTYKELVKEGSFAEALQYYEVKAGDVFSIPAGRVHALGAGIKVAEIQQASDTTFRIYDYNRRDKNGNLRELHVEEAGEAMDYEDARGDARIEYLHQANIAQPLVSGSSFTTLLYELTEPRIFDYSKRDTFVIWMCVEGECTIIDNNGFTESLICGEAVLIPAALKNIRVTPNNSVKILETYII
jgi:mannose-6-phosphate isomerase